MHHDLLAGIPLFAALSGDERWDLARLITVRDLPAPQALFWIGDVGSEFFVIRTGRVLITYPDHAGREITLAVLGPGDFLGEVSLLDGGPRTATARAESDASLLCIDRESFFKFIRGCPDSAIQMMSVLGKRQRETVDKLRGIRNLNEVMEERLTAWQRFANTIATMAANSYFLLTHAVVMLGWIVVNLALGENGPDPFPFPFLCFWSSTEAIFLSMFILISQNVQSQKDRLRTELEYQVALKAQFEIMQLHSKLDAMPQSVSEKLRESNAAADPAEAVAEVN